MGRLYSPYGCGRGRGHTLTWHVRTLSWHMLTWQFRIGRCGRVMLRHVASYGQVVWCHVAPCYWMVWLKVLESTGLDLVTSTSVQALTKSEQLTRHIICLVIYMGLYLFKFD